MYSMNNKKLQNGWINMWTEGNVAVSEKDYSGIIGVLATTPPPTPIWKHKCLIYIDATGCNKVLRGPSVEPKPGLVTKRVTRTALVTQLK
jgi:hypothetical protein